MGQKVIIRFWWESGLSSASRNHLTTFCRRFVHYACLRLCSAIVHFNGNNCLYFVSYWLRSACADRIDYITNFCSMIKLLHEFKNSSYWNRNIQAFDYVSAGKKKNEVCWTSIHNKNWTFACVLYAHSQFLCSLVRFDLANRGVRQPVQPHTSTACIWQDISAASFCTCKLLWRSDERVLLRCFNAQPVIFAVMNCCVLALSLFSCDILTCSADSLYSVHWHIN